MQTCRLTAIIYAVDFIWITDGFGKGARLKVDAALCMVSGVLRAFAKRALCHADQKISFLYGMH